MVDGSGDGTDEMLESLRVPYRLFVLRQDQRGAAAARNAGLDAAHGRTIIFIDDDVIPTPELVRAHASIHDRDDNAVVIGRFLPCPEAKRTGWVRWEDAIAARGYRRIQRGEATVDGSLFYSGNVSAPRQSLLDVGGFDTSLASQEDVELGHRLQAAGLTFYFEPRAAGFHCGQCPDFASWCRRHYRFGAYRFVIARRAGPANVSSIDESFARRNVLTLLLLRLTSGRPVAMDVSAAALRAAAMAVDFAHLWPVSRFVYSALANLHYWRGIQDRMVEDGYGDGYAVE